MDFYKAENYKGIRFFHTVEEHPVPDDFSRHCHEHYEIIYVKRGSGKYVVEGVCYDLRAETMMLFRPGDFHYVNVEHSEAYERYVLHFSTDELLATSDTVKALLEKPLFEGVFYETGSFSLSVTPVFEHFSRLSQLPQQLSEQMAPLLLSELLHLLSVASPTSHKSHREEPLGARVIRYVNAHMAEPQSLDALASEFYVSKFYLCRAFKQHNGISILGYINGKRVMMARQMLESGEAASVVSERVGFSDYSTFYRAYRKAYGHAPTAVRRTREKREVRS